MAFTGTRRRILGEGLLYLGLAAGLTFLLASFLGVRSASDGLSVFAVNMAISIGIGGALTGCYAVLRWLGLTGRGFGAVSLFGHALAMTASIFGGVFVALFVVERISPSATAVFPFHTVVQVAIPVTVTVVVVTTLLDRWRQRTAEAERAQLESELSAIQARINPHFLFNSLNTIAALIPEDAAGAEEAVLQLSGLLRHTLDGSKQRFVPLRDEVAATKRYLALESLRFGDKLHVRFAVDAGIDEVHVPPLVLQPLVENAVKHGIARRGGGRVEVGIVDGGDHIRIDVQDDGDGTVDAEGTKTAHRDLAKRLEILYEDAARFEIDRQGPIGGFRVILELPKRGPS